MRQYIPSFAETRVWRNGSTVAPVTEAITEELRIWHLPSHTSGLTYGFMQNHPVDALYRQAGFEWGIPDSATDLAGIVDHLAALPLVFQPGHGVAVLAWASTSSAGSSRSPPACRSRTSCRPTCSTRSA